MPWLPTHHLGYVKDLSSLARGCEQVRLLFFFPARGLWGRATAHNLVIYSGKMNILDI